MRGERVVLCSAKPLVEAEDAGGLPMFDVAARGSILSAAADLVAPDLDFSSTAVVESVDFSFAGIPAFVAFPAFSPRSRLPPALPDPRVVVTAAVGTNSTSCAVAAIKNTCVVMFGINA